MIPWAHLAVGYLLWSVLTHLWARRPPNDAETWLLLFGTQFPDLVDKPLAWTFGVLPSGRSFGHSLLTVAALFVIGYLVASRWDRTDLAVAFSVGHLSHSLSDTYRLLLSGQYEYLGYLLWPLLPAPYDAHRSILEYLRELSLADVLDFQLLIGVLVVLIWVHDGMPGLPSGRFRTPSTDDGTGQE